MSARELRLTRPCLSSLMSLVLLLVLRRLSSVSALMRTYGSRAKLMSAWLLSLQELPDLLLLRVQARVYQTNHTSQVHLGVVIKPWRCGTEGVFERVDLVRNCNSTVVLWVFCSSGHVLWLHLASRFTLSCNLRRCRRCWNWGTSSFRRHSWYNHVV